MIRFTCPYCGISLKAEDRRIGKLVHCPKCKTSIELPESLGECASLEDAEEVPAAALATPSYGHQAMPFSDSLDVEWQEAERNKRTGLLFLSLV